MNDTSFSQELIDGNYLKIAMDANGVHSAIGSVTNTCL
jgi:hypothetical protein